MSKESKLELVVGGFVILGFSLLTIIILSVGDFSFVDRGNNYHVIFSFASGIKKSAPVRIAGVETGMVKDIELFFDSSENKTKVEVLITVDKKVLVPKDSQVLINQLGLLGEKYVEILPGTDTQNFFKHGDVVIGKDPVIQEQISQRINQVAAKLEKGIDGFNEIVASEENQVSLRSTLQKFSGITDSLDAILNYVEAGEGTIGKLFYDSRLYEDLEAFTADLKANPWKLLYKPKGK